MNRIYKIIWNEALGCFTAVGEYAKGRGKSSKSSVGSSTTINTISHLSSINTLRLSAIVLGLLAAGFGMQANATGTENHHDGDYSHSHGSHGVHYHTTGNNSHNNNSNPDDSEGSISLKFEGDNATTITRTNGETLNILGGATGTLTNGNIGVFGIGDTLTIQLAENIDLGADGSLKTGDTLVDSSGIKITTSNPINNVLLGHSGLNNGNNIITGVAPGAINATSTDAVNGSQLHATNTAVNTNSTAISSGLNFDGDTGDTVNRQLGQTLTVKGGATNLSDNNIGVEANGSNALTVKLAKDLTGLTSVTTGDTLLNTDGVRFLGGSTVRLSSQGLDNGGNQITNV
ncbi:ESPR-type extended signal peptide-containing protein, partial [Psychrobacter aquaticus]